MRWGHISTICDNQSFSANGGGDSKTKYNIQLTPLTPAHSQLAPLTPSLLPMLPSLQLTPARSPHSSSLPACSPHSSSLPLLQLAPSLPPSSPEVVGTPIHTKLFIGHWKQAGSKGSKLEQGEQAGSKLE